MAKDNNEPTPKLPSTAGLRKLEQRWTDLSSRLKPDLEQLARSSGLKFSPAQLEQLARSGRLQFPVPAPLVTHGRLMRDELVRLRELVSELKTPTPAAPPVASSAREKRKQPQVDRILRAIPEVYPTGIDGIPDPVVRQKVADYLQPEIKTKGLAVPSADSFERALRQFRTRVSTRTRTR